MHLKPCLWDVKLGQNHIRNTVLGGPRSSLVEKLNPVLFSWNMSQISMRRLLGSQFLIGGGIKLTL